MKRWWKTKCFLIVSIAYIFLLVGCSQEESITLSQNSIHLNEWLGNYEFFEYFSLDINMRYSINIYKDDDKYFANININGFQTNKRIKADVIGNQEIIDLVFESYLPESTGESIEEGEILLSFKKEDSVIYTYWGVIKPILTESSNSGEIYFTKVQG